MPVILPEAGPKHQKTARLGAFHIEHPLPARYPIADPSEHPGAAYLEPFADSVASVCEWLADGLVGGPRPPTGLAVTVL
ncbi:MAG: hypothetical protein AAF845_06895 [Bacteroidota bacterium]